MRKVYNENGQLLNDYIDMSKLQSDTKVAIKQIAYLDRVVSAALDLSDTGQKKTNNSNIGV